VSSSCAWDVGCGWEKGEGEEVKSRRVHIPKTNYLFPLLLFLVFFQTLVGPSISCRSTSKAHTTPRVSIISFPLHSSCPTSKMTGACPSQPPLHGLASGFDFLCCAPTPFLLTPHTHRYELQMSDTHKEGTANSKPLLSALSFGGGVCRLLLASCLFWSVPLLSSFRLFLVILTEFSPSLSLLPTDRNTQAHTQAHKAIINHGRHVRSPGRRHQSQGEGGREGGKADSKHSSSSSSTHTYIHAYPSLLPSLSLLPVPFGLPPLRCPMPSTHPPYPTTSLPPSLPPSLPLSLPGPSLHAQGSYHHQQRHPEIQ